MHITRFRVEHLFNHFTHDLELERTHRDGRPSLAIIHGPNGVGKTTILKMLNAMLAGLARGNNRTLDVFFETPFERCTLWLSGAQPIIVTRTRGATNRRALLVEFGGVRATIERDMPRSVVMRDLEGIGFRQALSEALSELDFEFVETARIDRRILENSDQRRAELRAARAAHRATGDLTERVANFISQAQLNFQFFFQSEEPDLFERIMSRLTSPHPSPTEPSVLLAQLARIESIDEQAAQFGLARERWSPERLRELIQRANQQESPQEHVLAVAAQYLDMLDTRAIERSVITHRLKTFESLLAEFLEWKSVRLDPKVGFTITTDEGALLSEDDLSSGEHHLLYLMVSALVTRRKGTIVAIDEPEMSMHLSWQRRLVPALLQVAERAETQFILTTHSPDMAAEYWPEMFAIGTSS